MNNINQDVENKLYTQVADEIESKQIDRGIYAKALSESKGDKNQAEALYIKFRVEQLKFEIVKAEIVVEQELKASLKKRDNALLEAIFYGFIILVIVIILAQSMH